MREQKLVVIVESEGSHNGKCGSLLKSYGFQVQTCPRDGLKVLQCIKKEQPQVAVLEMFMPNLDALEVMRLLKKEPSSALPRFVVTTSFINPHLEREVMEAGASYCFLLPYDPEIMAERIARIAKSPVPQEGMLVADRPDLEVIVTEIIHQIGVPAHIKGYHYVRESIILAVDQPDIINSVTKQLYPEVAKRFGTTPSRVERAIRHAIEVAWDRGDVDTLNSYFGYTIHNSRGKPTNSEFVAMIADKIRLKLRNAF